MKKLLIALLVLVPANAWADEAWVKVDANGNAIGGAIVCTQAVCGNAESAYSKATLQPGEHYVMQSVADANGNVAGIGNNNPGTTAKVDLNTNEWTITRSNTVEIKSPIATETTPTITVTTNTIEKFNPLTPKPVVEPIPTPVITDTNTVTTETTTPTISDTPTTTNEVIIDPIFAEWLDQIKLYFESIFEFISGWYFL